MRIVVYCLAGLVTLGFALFAAAFLSKTTILPPPAITPGYTETTVTVAHRDVPLPVHLWYPTDARNAPDLLGQNALFYGHYAQRNAAMTGPAPVVILSHGSGGNAVQMGWLAAHLANQGFLVVAPNHPGTTSRDSLPARTVQIWERPADFRAILDWLAKTPPAGIQPDLSDVTSLGFSLGGHTALALAGVMVSKDRFIAYCDRNAGLVDCGWLAAGGVDFTTIDAARYNADHSDPRVTRTIAIDPALPQAVVPDSLTAVDHPTLVLNLGALDALPSAMRADAVAASLPDAHYATIPGSAHFSALPVCSGLGTFVIGLSGEDNICSDQGLRPRAQVHAEVLARIDAFVAR